MTKIYIKDLIKKINPVNDVDTNALKALIAALKSKKLLSEEKQFLIFEYDLFYYLWNMYIESKTFFDTNYNRKTDFKLYFMYLIDSIVNSDKLNFFALFCPGYTQHGYKSYLGKTTKWKLAELRKILEFYKSNNITVNIDSYYSDVFLENTDSSVNENWTNELDLNRKLFHVEGCKFFDSSNIKNASSIDIFKDKENVKGFVDYDIINKVNRRTYSSFTKSNLNFYTRMGFSDEQIKFRNDRLITMYRILSDYINSKNNTIFLPMENMYERENIFSENNTCTMYLKLKK